MKNLIIEKSFKHKNEILKRNIKNMVYDEILGFWISLTENKPLILSNSIYKPQTKKEDIETGEDRKGE